VGDVVRHVVAADADDAGRDEVAVGVHRVAGGAAADVEDERAVFALVLLKDGFGRAGRREERFADFEMGAFGGGARVLNAVAVAAAPLAMRCTATAISFRPE
jgi:hypothetical protein